MYTGEELRHTSAPDTWCNIRPFNHAEPVLKDPAVKVFPHVRTQEPSVTRVSVPQHKAGNQILYSLPAEEYSRLTPYLEPFPLLQGERLYQPHETIRHVIFPQSGTVSLVSQMRDGAQVEVGVVGSRGLLGLPIAFGTDAVPFGAVVQISGSALRMRAESFREEAGRCDHLHRLVLRYAQAFFVQTAQTAACNNMHGVSQRLARWLLMACDRAQSEKLQVTQEFIGSLVGVRRAGITETLGRYAAEGVIENRRGQVRVLDRERLERAACECYRIIGDEFDRLLGRRLGPERSAGEIGDEWSKGKRPRPAVGVLRSLR